MKTFSGTQTRVAMEVVVTVQIGPLVHALRILQRKKFPLATHRGGGHNEEHEAI